MKHTFTSNDGTMFNTASECKRYEEKTNLIELLRDLPADQIRNGLQRVDCDIANAFERAGKIIAAKRRESGELRRTKKVAAE